MVDIFGGSGGGGFLRGLTGPRGIAGNQGFEDMCLFMPQTVGMNFQKHEEVLCLHINDVAKDLKFDSNKRITEWLSRSNVKFNAVAEIPTKDLFKITDTCFGLDFDKNRYVVEGVTIMPQ